MLALMGALSEEIADLRRRMRAEETFAQQGCRICKGKYREKEVLLVETGMGKERAERATNLVLERYPVTALISLGFAGALTPESKVGDVILCSTLYCGNEQEEGNPRGPCSSHALLVSLAQETLQSQGVRWIQGSSVSVPQPVSPPQARRSLGQAFSAQAVDMESYWIARIASAQGIPFLGIRAISDTLEDALLPFHRLLEEGQWRWGRATLYFLSHPQKLVELLRLYLKARRARKNLTLFVEGFVAKL